MSNRAAVLHAPRDVRIEERPVPEPGPHEVLVEIGAVGVCGSDVHYYEEGRIAERIVKAPHVLGHESMGRVAATGDAVTKHAVGDRVTLEPGLPCGRCREMLVQVDPRNLDCEVLLPDDVVLPLRELLPNAWLEHLLVAHRA